jgi:uracil phosphoribosyltransferase
MNFNRKLTVLDHPLVREHLCLMRKAETSARAFVASARAISVCLLFEAIKDIGTVSIVIDTPLGEATCQTIDPSRNICVVSVLRAGLVISGAAEELIPNVVTYHIGLRRDSAPRKIINYYDNLPTSFSAHGLTGIYICDPMLATGETACMAIKMCLAREIAEERVKMLCILSCVEGIGAVFKTYPDVTIITAGVDEKLDDDARIFPGLGDAGDRMFGVHRDIRLR